MTRNPKHPTSIRLSDRSLSQLRELAALLETTQSNALARAIEEAHEKHVKENEMNTNDRNEWSNTASLYRNDYRTEAEYKQAYQAYSKHYSFKARVEGGWKFFTYSNDYETWKNQR